MTNLKLFNDVNMLPDIRLGWWKWNESNENLHFTPRTHRNRNIYLFARISSVSTHRLLSTMFFIRLTPFRMEDVLVERRRLAIWWIQLTERNQVFCFFADTISGRGHQRHSSICGSGSPSFNLWRIWTAKTVTESIALAHTSTPMQVQSRKLPCIMRKLFPIRAEKRIGTCCLLPSHSHQPTLVNFAVANWSSAGLTEHRVRPFGGSHNN